MMNATIEKALAAYGGVERWTSARRIEAEVSVHGLLFTLKGRPAFDHARMTLAVDRPYSRLTPIGKDPQITGVLDGQDVRLEDAGGKVIEERKGARQYFGKLGRLIR
jgi:hypothetical protein